MRLRPLTEAEAYARCYGDGDANVRFVKVTRGRRFSLRVSGEDLRRAFERRLERREPLEPEDAAAAALGEPTDDSNPAAAA